MNLVTPLPRCMILKLLFLLYPHFAYFQEHKQTQILTRNSAQDHKSPEYAITLPSTDDFRYFISSSTVFIDKSLLIEALYGNPHSVIMITCGARWGKTNNLNMFAFYSELFVDDQGVELPREKSPAYQYFINGLVFDEDGDEVLHEMNQKPLIHDFAKNDEHLVAHPVIRLRGHRLKLHRGIESLRSMIHLAYHLQEPLHNRLRNDTLFGTPVDNLEANATFEKFDMFYDVKQIRNMDIDTLLTGIHYLCKILHDTYNRKVVIIYDEYDHYVHDAFLSSSEKFQFTNETRQFQTYLNDFMLRTFKSNNYLYKAIITGVTNIQEDTYLSSFTHHYKSYVFDETNFFPFYGVYDWEFECLCDLHSRVNTSKNSTQLHIQYGGFRSLGKLDSPMFSIYSVAQCMNSMDGKCITYHQFGYASQIIKDLLQHAKFEEDLHEFMKHTNSTFTQISHGIFTAITMDDCEIISKLRFLEEIYDPDRHRDLVFSHLLNAGIASVHKEQPLYPKAVAITVPNQEVVEFLKKIILTKHNLLGNPIMTDRTAIHE